MQDTTHPLSRVETIAAFVIKRYIELGTIEQQLVEGILRSIDLLPCSLETLSDSQVVDIVGRLISVHYTATKHAQMKYDVADPQTSKLTEYVRKSIDKL